jgi:hypothetical protein
MILALNIYSTDFFYLIFLHDQCFAVEEVLVTLEKHIIKQLKYVELMDVKGY